MLSPFISKLRVHAAITDDDVDAVCRLLVPGVVHAARHDLLAEGAIPSKVMIVNTGWAARHHVLRTGERQIIDLLLPGDMLHAHALAALPSDCTVSTLTGVEMSYIHPAIFDDMLRRHPTIACSIERCELQDRRQMTASIVRLGRQDAFAKLGNLLCELWIRADNVGLVIGDSLTFPPTQADLADMLGLTPVHVNRMMRQMRASGLADIRNRVLRIPDLTHLARISGFGYKRASPTSHKAFGWHGVTNSPPPPFTMPGGAAV